MKTRCALLFLFTLLVCCTLVPGQDLAVTKVAPAVLEALPEKPVAEPESKRRLLVFTLCQGFVHDAIPLTSYVVAQMGDRTGAWETVVSDDIQAFSSATLQGFDAVCFNNTTGNFFQDPTLRANLIEFVETGGGIVGIHAATDSNYDWPEWAEMLGGWFDGHPWNEKVGIKVEEPDHPIVGMFPEDGFEIADEIYQFREYSREKVRVLLSLDTMRTDMTKDSIRRADGDFPITMIRTYGLGRVFYCSLGHRSSVFTNPAILRHYLAGIQFALGDLETDAQPR